MWFRMKELEKLKHHLGLKVEQMGKGVFLCQQKYARDISYKSLECLNASQYPSWWKLISNYVQAKATMTWMIQLFIDD